MKERPISIAHFDLTKHYDVHCSLMGEDRLYEDVRITGIRTLERITTFSPGLYGSYIEIEAHNGARILILRHCIRTLSEGGSQPAYRVLKSWLPAESGDTDTGSVENA